MGGANLIVKENTILRSTVELPERFRQNDILAFHQRDSQRIAERIDAATLRKGLMWLGHPACLTIHFSDRFATVELAIDGALAADDESMLARMVRRMLGLTQQVEEFERTYGQHPQLGPLISKNNGLRVPLTATPFEALTWAITGQQISVSAAVSVRRKLIQIAGAQHSSGLWCYPDAGRIAAMTQIDLRQAGLSMSKARTIIVLSECIEQKRLPLDEWADAPPVEEICTQLRQIRGIGPWTINYTLLRGFGWLDGSLHGDVAVRRNMQLLLGRSEKITENEARSWLDEFSPWRALLAAHLWAMRTKSDWQA